MNYEIKTVKRKMSKNALAAGICTTVFLFSFLTLLVYFTVFEVKEEEIEENEEIEMVFKEYGIYEAFDFDEIDKAADNVYDFSKEKQNKNE